MATIRSDCGWVEIKFLSRAISCTMTDAKDSVKRLKLSRLP